jgi:prevent-host-death family protein
MVDLSKDIHSLTDFKRKTSEFLTRLKATGDPVVLTVNGKAELVIQDAATYQRLLALAGLADDRTFLQASLADVEAGRTRPMREALESLGRNE